MSGIYIPGMEMPTTGLYLVSVDSSGGKDETVITVRRMLGSRDICLEVGAYNLIPVPDHRRLIDEKYIVPKDGYIIADGVTCIPVKDIVSAPTIIPADKEGDG